MQEPDVHPVPQPSPLRELLIVAIPAMATMVSYTIMQFIDGVMVSWLGPEAIAAQGNGSIVVFVLFAGVFGLTSVINTFVSQHLGAGNPHRTAAYLWNGLWLCLMCWALMLVLVPFLGVLFGSLNHEPAVVEMETVYARIQITGGFFILAARSTGQFFFGIHRAGVVLLASVCANSINILANYALIFGNLGMPELGVAGASIGTVLGSVIEFAIPMMIVLGPKMHAAFATRHGWKPSRKHLGDLLRLGWPAGVQQSNEIFCFTLFIAWIIGQLGTAHNAASWILLRYLQLSFMPIVGLSMAVTAVVGRHIGAGHPDRARHRAWLGVRLGMVYMGLFGLILLIFQKPMIELFLIEGISPQEAQEILRIGSGLVVWAVLFQIFDALGIVLIGALRGAGDTIIPGIIGASLSWASLVGLAYLLVSYRGEQWGSSGPWAAMALYIILLGLAMAARWHHGDWQSRAVVTRA
jgi:MATE family, multidrug efflux pump